MNNTTTLPETIYTPESQMRSPGLLLRAMVSDIKASRELSWRLFVRDLSAQYRQSIFGVLWAFVPPIITSVIFIILQSRNIVNFGETDIPYPVFVLVGTILWQLFTESLNAPLKSVTASKAVLVKINFPREALIISAVYLTLFNLSIKLVVLAVIFVIFQVPLTWGMLLAPVAIIMLMLLGITLGLLITPLGMLYTDVTTALPVILSLWFFLTPVVYPPPDVFPYSFIAMLNPVSPLLVAARDLLTLGEMTNVVAFLLVSLFTIVVLFIAWVLYRVSLPIIIERMSA
ncbi:MAG TPA: ABC transporter permease [Anaerolineae bacterium]|nr:ABC transporter permease [Anaerolineae bacterium]HIP72873.1 ABC transporter permease [Anaerolineae bacterium]